MLPCPCTHIVGICLSFQMPTPDAAIVKTSCSACCASQLPWWSRPSAWALDDHQHSPSRSALRTILLLCLCAAVLFSGFILDPPWPWANSIIVTTTRTELLPGQQPANENCPCTNTQLQYGTFAQLNDTQQTLQDQCGVDLEADLGTNLFPLRCVTQWHILRQLLSAHVLPRTAGPSSYHSPYFLTFGNFTADVTAQFGELAIPLLQNYCIFHVSHFMFALYKC